jgi:alpha-1,3-rhamnosyl/mannosyltransferase
LHAFRDSGLADSYDLLTIGGGLLSEAEQKRIAGLKLSDTVICLPRPSDEVLAEAYAGAKLFVYPSLNEGFGFPPIEAMSLGCPVLASCTSSIPEICLDAPFYFDPKDAESFRRELLRAVSDEPARAQATARGREVAAGYSWTRCGQETMAVYRDCQ